MTLLSRRGVAVASAVLVLAAGTAVGFLATRDGDHPKSGSKAAASGVDLPVVAPAGRTGVDRRLSDVVAVKGGFVAVGTETTGAGSQPLFLRSSDGSTWSSAALEADELGGANAAPAHLATGTTGVIAFGTAAQDIALWASSDGRSWQRRTIPKTVFRPEDTLVDVAALARGFVAVGSTETSATSSRGVVWTSPDGTSWTRRTAAQLGLKLQRTDEYFNAVATRGRQVVVVGGESDQTAARDKNSVAFWHSEDLGATWARSVTDRGLGGRNGGRSYGVTLTTTQRGFVAAGLGGESYFEDEYDATLMRSADGRTWRRDPREAPGLTGRGNDQPQGITVAADGTTVVVGGRDGDGLLVTQPAGGVPIDAGVQRADLQASGDQALHAVAAAGNVVVAVGHDGSSGNLEAVVYRRTKGAAFARVPLAGIGRLKPYASPVAAAGGTAVVDVVGSAAGDASWWQVRGSAATPVDLSGVSTASGPFGQRLLAVATKGTTTVAVGSTDGEHASQGLVLVRSGTQPVQTAQPFTLWGEQPNPYADRVVDDVIATSRGFVAVGYSDEGDSVFSARVFQSVDGTYWTGSASADLVGHQGTSRYLNAIATAPGGLLAVGSTGTGVNRPTVAAAWLSKDGRAWSLKRLPTPAGWLDATAAQATWAGDRWVVAGTATKPGDARAAVAWTSRDGNRWSAAVRVSQSDLTSVSSVLAVGDTLVAVGSSGPDATADAAAWTSTDAGATWAEDRDLEVREAGVQRWSRVVVQGSDVLLLGSSESATSLRPLYLTAGRQRLVVS